LASPVFCVGGALVGEGDDRALVEEGELAQAIGQGVVVVLGDGEDLRSGTKWTLVPRRLVVPVLIGAWWWERPRNSPAPRCAVAPDFQIELLGERVDAADADAVETTGNLVVEAVKLAAGVQHGHHDLGGGMTSPVGIHLIDGNATAVVDDGDGVVEMDGHVDALAYPASASSTELSTTS
jgi:hypothetical protein